MKNKIDVAIVGISGYTGLELIKILLNHPYFNITYIANSDGDTSVDILHPSLKNICNLEVLKADVVDIAKKAELAFLALPHKTSMGFVKQLLEHGLKVVDLSADYRLELSTYEKYYCPHEDKVNLVDSVYGLPEFYKEEITNARLVANPGCYPTASILALMPFVEHIEENASIFIDAKSGVSGAGKKLNDTTSFVNINDNIFAYNPLKHRHSPEIKEKIQLLSKKNLNINFVPHLIPITRGMLVSIYVSLKSDIDAKEVLKAFYKNSSFVRIVDAPVNVKNTAGTNYCDIFVAQNNKDIFINSSIDNLLRGASSAAVVNANIMCGLNEDIGIPKIAYVP